MAEAVFNAITSTIAELTVPERPHDFGVRTSGWPAVHEVGVYGAPRWRIRQSESPEDAWGLETLGDGRLLSRGRSVSEGLEWSYLTWAEGSRAESGAGVLHALPAGRYLLVRSGIAPRRVPGILLGGETVPSPANAELLLDARPFYAAVIGADGERAAVTDYPLVAVVALNYVGMHFVHGALFFDVVGRDASEAAVEREGDRVFVIPVTGELVIDAVAEFSAEQSQRDKDTWRDTGARQLAKALDPWSR